MVQSEESYEMSDENEDEYNDEEEEDENTIDSWLKHGFHEWLYEISYYYEFL